MYQLEGFSFEEYPHKKSTKVFYERLFIGYIINEMNIFIHTLSDFTISQNTNKKVFEYEKYLEELHIEESKSKGLFKKKVNHQFDIANNTSRINSERNKEKTLKEKVEKALEQLLSFLKENNIQYVTTNEAYVLLDNGGILREVDKDFEKLNISHLYDENLYNFYQLEKVNTFHEYAKATELLSRSCLDAFIHNDKFTLLDIHIEYDYFHNDDENKKSKLLNDNLIQSMQNQEMFDAVFYFYVKNFVKVKKLFAIYDGIPFYIKDDILYTFNTDESKVLNHLLFHFCMYSK